MALRGANANKRQLLLLLSASVAVIGVALAGLYASSGVYGFNELLRLNWSIWTRVAPDDPHLPTSVRLGLRDQPPAARAESIAWRAVAAGFEAGELPVIADGFEVDRILLARVDPARFRFVVRNAPAGNKELSDWMTELGAVLVINGSYFSPRGTPVTPLLSAGALSGPTEYDATHGAFVASRTVVRIHDLASEDWPTAFRGADDGVVSYPLLLAADGSSRVHADRHRLANRSFVAQDASGNIIFGTTKEAFFSLDRLAAFLREAPLGLIMALNLDGGPIACQAIALNGFRRDFCGSWELASHDGKLRLLTRVFGRKRWALPIVVAVLPRDG
jgi:phosphodiester glycosidase